jgi:hypothetical protein
MQELKLNIPFVLKISSKDGNCAKFFTWLLPLNKTQILGQFVDLHRLE